MAKLYPDISHYHTVRDWNAFADAVGFAISKGTQGTSFVDSYLQMFVKECEAHGIPYWLYVYLNKGNELKQTKFLIETCKPIVGKHFQGYALDAEEDNSPENIEEALNWLKTQSPKCMLYLGWEDKYEDLISGRGENVAWWEARYGKDDGTYNPKYPCHKGVDLHQFTSNGICPGIPDKVDLNRLTGNKPESWFTGKTITIPKKKGYKGEFPTLPKRGYFKQGDGMFPFRSLREEVKKVQSLINWINGGNIAVDGMYGAETKAAVGIAQAKLGVKVDGLFGEKTLAAAQKYKK